MATKTSIEDILKALRMGAVDTGLLGVRISREDLQTLNAHIAALQEVKVQYDAALAMSNIHGYAGMTAAEVIKDMAYGIKQLEGKNDD